MKTTERVTAPARPGARTVKLLFLLGVGALSGAGIWLSLRKAPALEPAAQTTAPEARALAVQLPPSRASAAAPSNRDPALANRLDSLERNLRELQARRDAIPQESRPGAESVDRVELERSNLQSYHGKIDKHWSAPVEPVWSKAASAKLTSAFAAIAAKDGSRGRLHRVDCRTNSCIASLAFPTFSAAHDGYAQYVTSFYEVNCGRSAMLEDPPDPAAPYTVDIVFEGCQ